MGSLEHLVILEAYSKFTNSLHALMLPYRGVYQNWEKHEHMRPSGMKANDLYLYGGIPIRLWMRRPVHRGLLALDSIYAELPKLHAGNVPETGENVQGFNAVTEPLFRAVPGADSAAFDDEDEIWNGKEWVAAE